jgi:hypothetical protein
MIIPRFGFFALALATAGALSCGGGNDSDRIGIAAECAKDADCPKVGDLQLTCLTAFKGGYCGLQGCTKDEECPTGAACIAQGGANYCFRTCVDKPECNVNRTVDNEANCVGSVTHVGASTAKACVPPSSGT